MSSEKLTKVYSFLSKFRFDRITVVSTLKVLNLNADVQLSRVEFRNEDKFSGTIPINVNNSVKLDFLCNLKLFKSDILAKKNVEHA